jgi:murein DD-endopeptidase MepM/ murein hydrolase activator NlpD
MKFYSSLLLIFLFSATAWPQLSDKAVNNLKNEIAHADSNCIYILPFAKAASHFLIQGYNSRMSHKNELSLDFLMKNGSIVCAARDGVVEDTKHNSQVGGLKEKYMFKANYIIIRHADSSTAWYWHLKKDGVLVSKGDTVIAGQHIAFSGNTGYSAFPHLHFQVIDKEGKNIPTQFYTRKGVKYLRPVNWYKRMQ